MHNALCAEQVRLLLEAQGIRIPVGDIRLQTIVDHINGGTPAGRAAVKEFIISEGVSQRKALTALDDLDFAAKPSTVTPISKAGSEASIPQTITQRVEQAIRGEWQVRGDPGHADLILVDLGRPHAMANPEIGLGPNQVRYQVTVRSSNGITFNVSVNFDPESGSFGQIKPASGKQ